MRLPLIGMLASPPFLGGRWRPGIRTRHRCPLLVLLLEEVLEADSLLVVSQDPFRVHAVGDALLEAATLAQLLALRIDPAVAIYYRN